VDVTWAARLEAARKGVMVPFGLAGLLIVIGLLREVGREWEQPAPYVANIFAWGCSLALGSRTSALGPLLGVLSGVGLAVFLNRHDASLLAFAWTLNALAHIGLLVLAIVRKFHRSAVADADLAAAKILTAENLAARRRSHGFRGKSSRHSAQKFTWKLVAIGLAVVAVPTLLTSRLPVHLAMGARRQARKKGTPDAAELETHDGRAPTLWLRPFANEENDLEKLVGHWFELLGPFITIQNPRDSEVWTDDSDAARHNIVEGRWEDWVEQKIRQARAIVMVVSRSDGVIWELRQLAALQALPKTILLFQRKLPAEEHRARWQTAVEHLGLGQAFLGLEAVDPAQVLAIAASPDGTLSVLTCRTRSLSAYAIALIVAISNLEATPAGSKVGHDRSEALAVVGALAVAAACVIGFQWRAQRILAQFRLERSRIETALGAAHDRSSVDALNQRLTALAPPDRASVLRRAAIERAKAPSAAPEVAITLYRLSVALNHDEAVHELDVSKFRKQEVEDRARAEVRRLAWLHESLIQVEHHDTPTNIQPGPAPLTEHERAILRSLAAALENDPSGKHRNCRVLTDALALRKILGEPKDRLELRAKVCNVFQKSRELGFDVENDATR